MGMPHRERMRGVAQGHGPTNGRPDQVRFTPTSRPQRHGAGTSVQCRFCCESQRAARGHYRRSPAFVRSLTFATKSAEFRHHWSAKRAVEAQHGSQGFAHLRSSMTGVKGIFCSLDPAWLDPACLRPRVNSIAKNARTVIRAKGNARIGDAPCLCREGTRPLQVRFAAGLAWSVGRESDRSACASHEQIRVRCLALNSPPRRGWRLALGPGDERVELGVARIDVIEQAVELSRCFS